MNVAIKRAAEGAAKLIVASVVVDILDKGVRKAKKAITDRVSVEVTFHKVEKTPVEIEEVVETA